MAARRSRGGAARHVAGHGPDRGHVRGRAAEYRWIEHDRARKPSTVRDYQSIINAHLLPEFATRRLEDITTEGVERWAAGLTAGGRMNNRTKLKVLTVLDGVMGRAPGLESAAQSRH